MRNGALGGWRASLDAAWDAAASAEALRHTNSSVAFVFVRALNRPLSYLRALATSLRVAPSGSGAHLVQKRELTSRDAACVRAAAAIGPVRVHYMRSSEEEAGPRGGRECSGYVMWLLHHWHALPAQMFFMHEAPPDHLNGAALAAASSLA